MTQTLEELMAEARSADGLGGRKLTFREQCKAFCALYDGVSNQIVAKAFRVSAQTASKISGCLEYDPDPRRTEFYRSVDPNTGQLTGDEDAVTIQRDHNRRRLPNRVRHYEDVGREFLALGRDEFFRRYYTEDVIKRIILAKAELLAERRAKQ